MAEFQKPKCNPETCGGIDGEETLCAACVQYINQDFVPQRETTMPGFTIDKIDPEDLPLDLRAKIERPKGIPKLDRILREARLTRQQRKVLRLYLFEGKSFSDIGDSLTISKACAQKHFDRALKRAAKRLTISTWLKDLGFKDPNGLSQNRSADGDPNKLIDSHQFHSSCSECGHPDLHATDTGGSCLSCGWEFTCK